MEEESKLLPVLMLVAMLVFVVGGAVDAGNRFVGTRPATFVDALPREGRQRQLDPRLTARVRLDNGAIIGLDIPANVVARLRPGDPVSVGEFRSRLLRRPTFVWQPAAPAPVGAGGGTPP